MEDRVKLIRENHVKEVTNADLVAWAVRSLYREAEEKIPAEINKRLTNVKNLDENELQTLLTNWRGATGKREDLDKHHDIDYTLPHMLKHLDPYTTYIDPARSTVPHGRSRATSPASASRIRKDTVTDHAAGGHADQGQPRLQGRPQGRRHHHQDHPRDGQQGQAAPTSRR